MNTQAGGNPAIITLNGDQMRISIVATSLVTLVVAVMVIALIAVPVVEDASRGTPYTSENNSYDARYALLTNPTFTLTIVNGVTTVVIDDRSETIPVNADVPVVMCSDFVFRVRSTGTTYYNLDNNTWSSVSDSSVALTVEATAGAWTMTRGDTEIGSGTIDNCFVRSSTGDYGVFTGSPKITLHDTYYIGSFFNISGNGPFRLYSAQDSTVKTMIVEPFGAATVDGQHVVNNGYTVTSKINYSQIGGNQAVGMVDSVNWTWTDGSASGSGTNTYIISAIEYTSTPLGTGDDTNSILLSIIPIMLIIVAIMVAVRIIRDA